VPRLPHHALNAALFVLLGGLWGSSYLAVKLAGTSMGPASFVVIRLAFAVAFIGAVALASRLPLPSRRELPHLAIVAMTGVVAPFVLITWGQRDIDAGLASIFNAATPLFTVLLAAVVLRDEPLQLGKLLGIGLGLGGVAVVVGGGANAGGQPISMLAILLGAASYAVTAVHSRRFLRGSRPLSVAFGQALGGLALTIGLAIVLERPTLAVPASEALVAAAYLGVASSGVAALIFFRLISTWGAGQTTLVNYLIPVVGVVLGAVVLGERLDVAVLAGGALVIAGVAVAGGSGNPIRLPRPARSALARHRAARPLAAPPLAAPHAPASEGLDPAPA